RRGLGVSKAAWEQHRLGKAASLMRDRNLLRVKVQAIPRAKRAALGFWICACLLHWCGNPITLSVPRSAHRILEKQGPFDHRCTKTEKLDSFAIDFAFEGF